MSSLLRCSLKTSALVLSLSATCCFAASSTLRLGLQPQAGLSITGVVGTVYAVQYATNLVNPTWRCLTFHKAPSAASVVPGTAPLGNGTRFYRATIVSWSNMVYLTPGTFTLGSPATEVGRYSDEGPQTTVTFSKGIFMCAYLVTQQDYQSVVGSNPSSFTGNPTRPVEQVSWQEATNYCRLLTQREQAAGRIPAGSEFRLPTEAEWEYACRAGTTTRFNYGDDPGYSLLMNKAWFADNGGDSTHSVGQQPANPWGLYDMHGNVWEWCQDWYGPYPGGNATDPQQADSSSGSRVLRGGSWIDDGRFCRSACRIGDDPTANFYNYYGFRIVLAPRG